MEHYTYLIIGGGMAADSAVKGIREIDRSGRIGLICQEEYPPYDRPPLTKGLWFGKGVESIWRNTKAENATLHLGKTAVSIQPSKHLVKDGCGGEYTYEKLLLATGGTPKKLSCPDAGTLYFRTLKDYYRLRELYELGRDFVVIGAGYIGTELAAALAMNGKNVTLIHRSPSIGYKKFPKKMAAFLDALYTEKGVRLVPEQTIAAISEEGGSFLVKTEAGEVFQADGVLAGLGIDPNVELGHAIQASIENGITVDSYLKTSDPDIWASGDVANVYNPILEKNIRIEHEDAANSMGRAAGRNMAGAKEPYTYLPFFYSDLFEIGYEAIGEVSSELEMLEEWEDPYREGAIYYLRDGKLRGALFVNQPNHIDQARTLISSKEPFSLSSLKP